VVEPPRLIRPEREKAMTTTDFLVENHSSIFILRPISATAIEWVHQHVDRDNGYQPYWPTVVVETRYVGALLQGIDEAGLSMIERKTSGELRKIIVHVLPETPFDQEMRRRAEALIKAGKMPSFEEVNDVVQKCLREWKEEKQQKKKIN
jgi:hypothetical protein